MNDGREASGLFPSENNGRYDSRWKKIFKNLYDRLVLLLEIILNKKGMKLSEVLFHE